MSSSNISEPAPMAVDGTAEEIPSNDRKRTLKEDCCNASKKLKLNLKPFPQNFSFPTTLIYYMAKMANGPISTKLIKSCKTFYHLIQGYQIEKLNAKNIINYSDDVASKPIKITKTLYILFLPQKTLDLLLKLKLDLSNVKEIQFFNTGPILPLKFFDFVLHPSIKVFWCVSHFDTPISPTLKAFEVLQNAKEIYQTCIYNALTKSDFKKLLKIKRNKKLKICGLAVDFDVDPKDIILFLDIHMKACSNPCSRLTLCIRGNNEGLKDYVNEILKKRRETSDEVPEVKIEFRNL